MLFVGVQQFNTDLRYEHCRHWLCDHWVEVQVCNGYLAEQTEKEKGSEAQSYSSSYLRFLTPVLIPEGGYSSKLGCNGLHYIGSSMFLSHCSYHYNIGIWNNSNHPFIYKSSC